jgi:hypothetical protein
MINWKTFLSGLALAVSLNLDSMGVPPKIAKPIQAIAAIALGANGKDKDVTGVGRSAKRNSE